MDHNGKKEARRLGLEASSEFEREPPSTFTRSIVGNCSSSLMADIPSKSGGATKTKVGCIAGEKAAKRAKLVSSSATLPLVSPPASKATAKKKRGLSRGSAAVTAAQNQKPQKATPSFKELDDRARGLLDDQCEPSTSFKTRAVIRRHTRSWKDKSNPDRQGATETDYRSECLKIGMAPADPDRIDSQPHAGINAALGSAFNTRGEVNPTQNSASHMPVGLHVELRGLKVKPELNGQRGVVVGFVAAFGRCEVTLNNGGGTFRFKAENLLPLA
jgi:hypothetical protein